MNRIKLSLAALGVSAALAVGSAGAAIDWNPIGSFTTFEDDDLDAILDSNLNPKAGGVLEVGDVLFSVVEIVNDAGGAIGPGEELTGVVGIQIQDIVNGTGPTVDDNDIIFGPYSGGLNALLALGSTDETVPGGGAGGGAMAALWLDPTPELDISAINLPIPPGSFSCSTLSQCIDQAVDGGDFAGNTDLQWQVDGFTGDPDELWVSTNTVLTTQTVLDTLPGLDVSDFNGAVNVIFNGTGKQLGQLSCFPFCNPIPTPGQDGLVDVVLSGSVKGGVGLPQSLIDDGVFGTSDFDFNKVQVPEPSTVVLLAAGFLGLGAAQRRRRRKASGV